MNKALLEQVRAALLLAKETQEFLIAQLGEGLERILQRKFVHSCMEQSIKALEAIEAELAKPEQDAAPVAPEPLGYTSEECIKATMANCSCHIKGFIYEHQQGCNQLALYTSPPIVALSDEEISKIATSIVRSVCEIEIAKPLDFDDDELIVTVDQLKFICIDAISAALISKVGAK